MTAEPPRLLTTPEAMALLRVRSKTWLYARADELGVIRETGRLLFPESDLVAWIERHRTRTVVSLPTPQPTPQSERVRADLPSLADFSLRTRRKAR